MSKRVSVGSAIIGGDKILVQSMTTTKTAEVKKTVDEIARLEAVGCDIVRVAVADESDAYALREVKAQINLPVVADIHFCPNLAVLAIENGADKVRINPGNIGGVRDIERVADCIKTHKIPVRVGANTGSIEKSFLKKYGKSADALVESALLGARVFEKYGVEDIVLSVKASSVPLTVEAYEKLHEKCDYPLHLGVTEAGTEREGIIKSSIGIGSLLLKGIGDTIRVSLSDDPVKEVIAGKGILRALGLEKEYIEVVACPTCGRCEWESMRLAKKVADFVFPYRKRLKVAVMGCVVNGPGEAKDADLGIAGGKGNCLIFKKGEPYKKVANEEAEEEFFAELKRLIDE